MAERANVDDLFAKMFGGTCGASGGPEGATPLPKVSYDTDENAAPEVPTEEAPAEETPAGETPAEEAPVQKSTGEGKSKRGGKHAKAERRSPAQSAHPEYYRGQAVSKRGRVRASFWLTPEVLDGLETRSFLEKCQGKSGEKSEIVEAAMRNYLEKELNTALDELFASK
ncbi:hypothetical protein [Flavonifractor sp. An306]|uniref:hypothetical protein n=1 Tax=Flavonifractor sp. An306 TaxID=1965629 RepID=UPI0017489FAB|nr:hypothetical protein [Flavonifractor sp. An306]